MFGYLGEKTYFCTRKPNNNNKKIKTMQILKVIQKHGYTLEQVATMLGITKGSLSATINGSPNVKKLIDIALKIGCSPAEFFDDWYETEGKSQERPQTEQPAPQPAAEPAPKTEATASDELPFGSEPKRETVPGVVVCPHCKGHFVAEITFKAV